MKKYGLRFRKPRLTVVRILGVDYTTPLRQQRLVLTSPASGSTLEIYLAFELKATEFLKSFLVFGRWRSPGTINLTVTISDDAGSTSPLAAIFIVQGQKYLSIRGDRRTNGPWE
jgi:hypothetical protein